MKTDSEIAHEAKLNLIGDIARQINIPEDDLEPYGKYMAKVPYTLIDDEKVKKELQDKFPGRVITLMDDTSRDSLEGMKFAVVDLFCLSKTKKILGSVASSYSQIAAEIGGIKVEYAKCNEN